MTTAQLGMTVYVFFISRAYIKWIAEIQADKALYPKYPRNPQNSFQVQVGY